MKRFVYIDEEAGDGDKAFAVSIDCCVAAYGSRATAEIVTKEMQAAVMQVKKKYAKHEYKF